MPHEQLPAEAVSNPTHSVRATQAFGEFDGCWHIVLHHIVEVEGADALRLTRLIGATVLE